MQIICSHRISTIENTDKLLYLNNGKQVIFGNTKINLNKKIIKLFSIGSRMKIWLSDLTYTQQTISSDIIPAAIGMIAEYLEKEIESEIDIKLFKYPEDLIEEIEKKDYPDVFGVSNYIWNHNLSSLFCKILKEKSKKTKIVMGGPNFPTNDEEQQIFKKRTLD